MTNIVEDGSGRIWFQNFGGQVYYIQDGVTRLLDSYDYKNEFQTPKMAICNNKLLITSYKGLFVLNIDDFKSTFFDFESQKHNSLVSLSVINKSAVIYNGMDWYYYDNNNLIKVSLDPGLQLPKYNNIQLQTASLKDTIFLTTNPEGNLYKLKLSGNRLVFLSKQNYADFINGVSVSKDVWLCKLPQSSAKLV